MKRKKVNSDRLTGTQVKKYRDSLLKEQKNIDPITKTEITDPVLDHEHFDEQRCRGVLQREVNAFEGKVYNAYIRYIKHITDESLPDVLRSLANYLERDTGALKIHHTALTVDIKRFKNLPATEQIEILSSFGIQAGKNNVERAKQIKKFIKDGSFKMHEYLNKKKGL